MHIRKVFLYGCTDTLPAALDELRDRESAGEDCSARRVFLCVV